MDKIVGIEDRLPHEVAEVMCWKCGARWIAVFPVQTQLISLECHICHHVGGVFKTGQTIEQQEYPE